MSELDITIVGGGFGSFVGELLSQEGFSVTLYERNRNRHVVCGGLVNKRTVKRYPFLREFEINKVNGALITSKGEEVFVEKRGVAYVLDRDEMFRGMLERAESEGVNVVYKEWIGERGDIIIGADGALSSIRKEVTRRKVHYILGVQSIISYDEDYVRVDFGPWSPSFFGWVIPLGDGRAHIGIGVEPEEGGNTVKKLKMYADFLGVDFNGIEGRLIPIDRPLWNVEKGNVYLLGDAALQTKATTGGGISFGLRGAELLAKSIGEGISYNYLHRRYLYPSLFLHWLIHNVLLHLPTNHLLSWIEKHYLHLLRRGDMDDPFSIIHPKLLLYLPNLLSLRL